MYDYSGEFAFLNGFPCKSGVGGSLLMVIPGVAGFCTWSPRLDKHGNSARGIEFCQHLAARFPFHMLDKQQYLGGNPAGAEGEGEGEAEMVELWNAAAAGTLLRLRQLAARGLPIDYGDYDGRTAAHLAASNGHLAALQYIVGRAGGARALAATTTARNGRVEVGAHGAPRGRAGGGAG
jgi:glutaminase